jgi:hypothetical protein
MRCRPVVSSQVRAFTCLEYSADGCAITGGREARVLPNPRMQPTGRRCPGLPPGAASLEDVAEPRFVRARA